MNWKKAPSSSLCKRALHEFWSRTADRRTIKIKLKDRRIYAYESVACDSVCFGFKILNKEARTVDYHAIRLSREALDAMVSMAKELKTMPKGEGEK